MGVGVVSVWRAGLSDEENWLVTGSLLDVLIGNGYVVRAASAPRGPCWMVEDIRLDDLVRIARDFGEGFVLHGSDGDLKLFRC